MKRQPRMGENIYKWSNWKGINLQNIQIAHAAQKKKKKTKNKKHHHPIKTWVEYLNRHISKEDIQMGKRHMKRCLASLASLIMREMRQICNELSLHTTQKGHHQKVYKH